MIRLDNVKVSFKDKVAVDLGRVVEIKDGERVGIIGSNGAGKTTLLRSILGLVPHKGNITLSIPSNEIAVHMQQNSYIETVPIRVIIEMIKFFEFEECLKKRWKHLSGGQKQRLTLILVMCKDSEIAMFDEVTSGLDFETRQRLVEKLVEWYRDRKTTLLITSHYYTELDNLATKILYLKDGRVVDYGSKEELFRKYCGNAVLIFEDTERASAIAKDHKRIFSSDEDIALSCSSMEEELEITEKLIKNHINYRRSDNDIEMMTINAGRNDE